MITILPTSSRTDREWNFRDDNHQNFFGDLPKDSSVVTLTLNWKENKEARPRLVGKYQINMGELLEEGFAREVERGIRLRFQRNGELIEIAKSSSSNALVVGRRPD
ncbi:MAG: hypothetical protein Q7Q71_06490 [Verrucomicrobiota bacterium JB023]|nr:hypothetical protein [Verrucomicrobiota bacterium JB023]